jgi:Secretion system effector C (SseC) like family
MSSGSIGSSPNTIAFDPTALLGQLDDVKQQASKSITQALTTLGVVLSGTNTDSSGKTKLQPPSNLISNVSDMTLRIGLLQEALSNLQAQVTKLQITNRMNESNNQAQEQLDKIQKQIKDAQAAAQKQQEANKKSGIFGAIAHFFGAIFDFITAVVNIIEAIPLAIAGDEAGAAALFASAACLVGAGVCETVLGVDSAMQAATGKGFLSDADKKNLGTAVAVLSAVAAFAAVISGIGVITDGIMAATSAAKTAIAEGAEEAVIQGTKEGVVEGTSEALEEVTVQSTESSTKEIMDAVKQGVGRVLKDIFKSGTEVREELTGAAKAAEDAFRDAAESTLRALKDAARKTALLNIIGGASPQVISAVGTFVTNPIYAESAQDSKDAQYDQAEAKAISAAIDKIKKQIQVLEKMLQQMMQSSMQSVTSVLDSANKSEEAVGKLIQQSI